MGDMDTMRRAYASLTTENQRLRLDNEDMSRTIKYVWQTGFLWGVAFTLVVSGLFAASSWLF
jgi:hypothetical protein